MSRLKPPWEPRLDRPFDVQVVLRAVGSAACSKGLKYFEAGRVLSLNWQVGGSKPAISAEVQGSVASPYSVTAYPDAVSARAAPGVSGTCTCPVRLNCKHVAAVLFAVGRLPIGGSPPGVRRGKPGYDDNPAAPLPPWEQELSLVAPVVPAGWDVDIGGRGQRELPSVALLIEARTRSNGAPALLMRPLRLSDQGRWVRMGISWRDLTYFDPRIPDGPGDVLREILRMHTIAAQRSSDDRDFTQEGMVDPRTIDLVRFPSARIWPILAEASAAQLPLLSSVDGTSVQLVDDPAEPEIVVTSVLNFGAESTVIRDLGRTSGRERSPAPDHRDGVDWRLIPRVTVAGDDISTGMTLLGDPAHGVAWTDSGRLHLARLARPLEVAPRRLLSASEPILVPMADRGRFLRDYLPILRTHFPVIADDLDSVDLPTLQPGRLCLVVSRDGPRRVRVSWSWRYAWAGEVFEFPINSSNRAELRDHESESLLLQRVLAATGGVAPMQRRGPLGWELVPDTVLMIADAVRFSRDVLPQLMDLDGVDVDIAEGALDFREAAHPPVVTVSGAPSEHTDWLDLTITITVDGQVVAFKDVFRALASGQEFVVLPSGTYFLVSQPELKQLKAIIDESFELEDRDSESLPASKFHVSLWAELDAMGVLDRQAQAWAESVRGLSQVTDIPQPPVPANVTAVLRPYQQVGFTWLSFLHDHQLGGVLADDMGLGKTIQALAMIARARAENPGHPPFLVVAPTSVVPNWVEEARRFTPALSAVAVSATAKRRGVSLVDVADGADVVVTSYALFRLEYDDYAAIPWAGLLLDEAQHIKNHLAKGYRCARSLPVPFKVAITGTPMENHLMELWAMFSIVAPGLLGDPLRFGERYRHPIERSGDTERLAELRRRIRPLLLRRTKEEVAPDLPPKSEQVVDVELGPKHRRAYQQFLNRERRKLLGLIGDMDRNRFQIFRSLTLLRQAALDVSLVDDEHATVPSSKLEALMEIVAGASAEGHRVLVFSQFTRFLARVRLRLDAASIEYCYLDGRTRDRAAVLAAFRGGDAPVFLISLKAGGVGLNLTEADYCVLTDPWWNPAAETQAIDRAHRIGQTKPVMVYRLVATDTIEQKVMALSARKAKLVASVLTEGGIGRAGLTAADVRALLT